MNHEEITKKRDKAFRELQEVLADELEIKKDLILKDANLRVDLGLDSLDFYEILHKIEMKTEVSIEENEIIDCVIVEDIHNIICEKKGLIEKKE